MPAATHSEETTEQAIRSVCERVGITSLKEKQREALKAIVCKKDTFICLPTLSRTQRATKVKQFVGFSLKMLRCKARAVPVLYG